MTVELFTVSPGEDEAFRAAWTAAARPGATLHRALREDVQPRYAALDPGGPDRGVLLIVAHEGDEAAWQPVIERWSGRQGFIGAWLPDGAAVVHWSSPLMYARAVREEGDLVAALPFATRPALYVHELRRSTARRPSG